MPKIDTTKYNAQVTNAAAQVKISSTIFKNFIADVKSVIDENSPEGRFAADVGSTDTYTVTLDPVPAAYATGMIYRFKANTANTGACTVNVNSLGAKTIKKNVSDDMETGDILANQMIEMMYDGTNMQIISASSELKKHKDESSEKHIAESGSNANGRYLKFDDGTQICWCDATLTFNSATSLFKEITFPSQFLSGTDLKVSSEINSDLISAWRGKTQLVTRNATGATVQSLMYADSSIFIAGNTQDIGIIAIGRWK